MQVSQVELVVKNPPANAGDLRDAGLIPGGDHGNPLQYCLENSHGQRSLVGYSPWGHKELDMTEAIYHAQAECRRCFRGAERCSGGC